MTSKEMLSAEELDKLADDGEVDMTQFMKPGTLKMPNLERNQYELRKVTSSIPEWVLDAAERRAARIGTSRAAVINTWLADKADESNRELAAS